MNSQILTAERRLDTPVASSTLLRRIRQAIRSGSTSVAVDLSQVVLMGALAARLLLALQNDLRQQNCQLCLLEPSDIASRSLAAATRKTRAA